MSDSENDASVSSNGDQLSENDTPESENMFDFSDTDKEDSESYISDSSYEEFSDQDSQHHEERIASEKSTSGSKEYSDKEDTVTKFDCELKPMSYLKLAVAGLLEPDFNPNDCVRIDVDNKGLKMKVQNNNNTCMGFLHLKPPGFKCNRSRKGQLLDDFRQEVYEKLGKYKDERSIHVRCLKGTDKIEFIQEAEAEAEARENFVVELSYHDGEIIRFTESPLYKVSSSSMEKFNEMLEHGSTYSGVPVKVCGERGVIYRGTFQWTRGGEFLHKAAELVAQILIGLYRFNEPRHHIAIRFILKDNMGYLQYVKAASEERVIKAESDESANDKKETEYEDSTNEKKRKNLGGSRMFDSASKRKRI